MEDSPGVLHATWFPDGANFRLDCYTNMYLSNCSEQVRSSGQSSWLQIRRSPVRFPVLPDFLRSSVSGTGSTQPRKDN
jgi:hypothetical protein